MRTGKVYDLGLKALMCGSADDGHRLKVAAPEVRVEAATAATDFFPGGLWMAARSELWVSSQKSCC